MIAATPLSRNVPERGVMATEPAYLVAVGIAAWSSGPRVVRIFGRGRHCRMEFWPSGCPHIWSRPLGPVGRITGRAALPSPLNSRTGSTVAPP